MTFKRILAVILGLTLVTGIIFVSSPAARLTGLLVLAGYFFVSGLVFLKVPRTPLIAWYQSQGWFFTGTGPVDILFKQIGSRISIEAFAFVLSAIVGGLGGAYWILLRSPTETGREMES